MRSKNTEVSKASVVSLRFAQNLVTVCAAVSVDAATAERYGHFKAERMAAGQIIPHNDLWIAALAKQHDLTLVSRDRHFSQVIGLKWVVW